MANSKVEIPQLIRIASERYSMTELQRTEYYQKNQDTTFEIKGFIQQITSKQLLVRVSVYLYFPNSEYGDFLFSFNYDAADKERLIEFHLNDYVSCSGNKIKDHPKTIGQIGLELTLVEIQKLIYPQSNPSNNSGCFIATACYGNYNAPEVIALRQFRDEKLLNTFFGIVFVKLYYSVSPFFAQLISKSDLQKKWVRQYFLEPIIAKLKRQNKL